jgi:hypothetical protein
MSDHYREMNIICGINKSDKKNLRRSCFTLTSHKYFVSILVLLINKFKESRFLVTMAKKNENIK